MDTVQNGVPDVKDVPTPKPDVAQIKVWFKQDMQRLQSLVNALAHDEDLQDVMAEWFHGRMMNFEDLHHRPSPNAKRQ